MDPMFVILLLATGGIVILVVTKVTRWYELLMLGGWGILLGAGLAGARSFSGMSLASLWGAIFP